MYRYRNFDLCNHSFAVLEAQKAFQRHIVYVNVYNICIYVRVMCVCVCLHMNYHKWQRCRRQASRLLTCVYAYIYINVHDILYKNVCMYKYLQHIYTYAC